MKKAIIGVILLLIPLTVESNVHDDWATVHLIDATTGHLVHTASTYSTDASAVLTVDCDKNITLYESKRPLGSADSDDVWYSTDGSPYKNVKPDLVVENEVVTTYVGRSDAIERLRRSKVVDYIVNDSHGRTYEYTFSMIGAESAYKEMSRLCSW